MFEGPRCTVRRLCLVRYSDAHCRPTLFSNGRQYESGNRIVWGVESKFSGKCQPKCYEDYYLNEEASIQNL